MALLDEYHRESVSRAAESVKRFRAGESPPPHPFVPVHVQLLALNGFNMVVRRLSEFFLFSSRKPYLRATDLVPSWTKEGKPYLEYLSGVIDVYNERVAHYTTKWGTGEGFGWPTGLTACIFVESLSTFRTELLESENSHFASAIRLPPGADDYCWADTISEWNEVRGEHDFPPAR